MNSITAAKFETMAKAVHATAKSKGWWKLREDGTADFSSRVFEELLFLTVSELVEAFEVYRDNIALTQIWKDEKKEDKPEGFPIELADFVIRMADTIEAAGILDRVCSVIKSDEEVWAKDEKMSFNLGSNVGKDLMAITSVISLLDSVDMAFDEHAIEQFVVSLEMAFELADLHKIDLWHAIELKTTYNLTREFRHGGKAA